MKWWNKISVKITLAILLMAVVPLGGFGIMSIAKIRSALLASVSQTNFAAAKRAGATIEAAIHDTIVDIRIIMENNGFEGQNRYDREWSLQLMLKSFPQLSSMMVTNTSGTPLLKVTKEDTYSPGDIETRQEIKTAFDTLNTKQRLRPISRTSHGFLILPVDLFFVDPQVRENSFALTLEINMNRLLENVSDQHILNAGYLYVLDKKGEIVLYPDKSVALAREKAMYNPLADLFVQGKKVPITLARHMNRDNTPVVSNAFVTAQPRLLVVVEQTAAKAMASANLILKWQVMAITAVVLVSALLSLYFVLRLSRPINKLENGVALISKGNFDVSIPIGSPDEIGNVTKAFNEMAASLKQAKKKDLDLLWIEQGISRLEAILREEQVFERSCGELINFLCGHVRSHIGLLYIRTHENRFKPVAGFAVSPGQGGQAQFGFGEGLTGQCATEKKIRYMENLPHAFFTVCSGLGEMPPRQLAIIPLIFNDEVEGILELGTLNTFTNIDKQFLKEAAGRIGVALNAARSRQEQNRLLEETKTQKQILEKQQEELRAANEELEEQTQQLTASEDQLRKQQEELQASNEELEEKTQFLERNRIQIEEKNRALEQMKAELTKKAEDLALSSKYKSEFLANMSHELRTPLNSLLLLAKILSENKESNLTQDQVESAQVIFSSGSDLLNMINEILDLSKIEAGKMTLNFCEIKISELARNLETTFAHLAREKNLELDVRVDPDCLSSISSDFERVRQVLKNLMANAVKFTSQGGIYLTFYRPENDVVYQSRGLTGNNILAVSVRDTGIGIAPNKQALIFEAFQQSDGGISRKYGGTGLGLSICRELSKLLGGEIHLQSDEGKGSTFTLYLPAGLDRKKQTIEKKTQTAHQLSAPLFLTKKAETLPDIPDESRVHLPDDRDEITPDSKSVLIIEDDINFGKTLMDFCAKRGFLCLYSTTGENGISLARQYIPKAVILDITLPGMDGWAVFHSLKENAATRHIPVHFMSVEEPVFNVLNQGATGFLTKPVSPKSLETALDRIEAVITKKVKYLLIVEDDVTQQKSIKRLLTGRDIAIDNAPSGKKALEAVKSKSYDCIILDLGLPDMTGFELLEFLTNDQEIALPPIIVYTGRDLSFEEEGILRRYSESIIIKGVKSEERLLDETSLFLHRMIKDLPADKKQIITDIHNSDQMFDGRTILIVDDDMRNVFALAKVLAERKMTVLKAENGQKALEMIKNNSKIDLVLMDIMMPVMNGYEAIKKIRKDTKFAHLPIIALTAKAMKQDKRNCIEAGANDYLTKPVDIDRLLSMMRVWLYE
ncbi:response regulator [Desulfobacter curvatus]|uniref:response regulator n=1 Tax=Desulfobacter curvatus TaxID=2290 RepID=UPI000362695F|nr:response regulator [Desulfobacter curvatus]